MSNDIASIMDTVNDSNHKGVIALSGGGIVGLEKMMAHPGSSATILQVDFRQEPQAIDNYLGYKPESYCCEATTRSSAMRALQLAEKIGGNFGMAVNCTLKSKKPHRGLHRFFIAIQLIDKSICYSTTLKKDLRDRLGEEEIVATMMVNALAHLVGIDNRLMDMRLTSELVDSHTKRFVPAFESWQKLRQGLIPLASDDEFDKKPGEFAVFPGSFNPIHQGHIDMQRIGAEILRMPVVLEISIENADAKPPLDYIDMRTRYLDAKKNGCDVVFTRAPLFLDKIKVFGKQVPFVVGIDTMERIGDYKFYRSAYPGEDDQIHEWMMGEYETYKNRFLVFGRERDGKFATVVNSQIPNRLKDLCDQVPQERFQVNMSSTKIRRGS